MRRQRTITRLWCCAIPLLGGLLCLPVQAINLPRSRFQQDQDRLRYSLAAQTADPNASSGADQPYLTEGSDQPVAGQKSPAKAFVLSLIVPGAGQWYEGSRIRPFIYLGVEAVAWGLHAKYHASGNDKTDAFQAFNQEHWSRAAYSTYLTWTYGYSTDDSIDISTYGEITHHLPSTNTQQYYEMTGKYDQFSWGWDDAKLNDSSLNSFSASNPPPRVINGNVPKSPHRDAYETMREVANKEFDKATKMLMLVLANHVVSAFEAFVTTKAHNRAIEGEDDSSASRGGNFFSELRIRPSLRSMHSKRDTPYVSVTYKF